MAASVAVIIINLPIFSDPVWYFLQCSSNRADQMHSNLSCLLVNLNVVNLNVVNLKDVSLSAIQ